MGVGLRCLQRRRQTEEDPRQQRDAHGESEHAEVDANFFCARNCIGQEPERGMHAPGREQQSDSTAHNPQQNTFGEHLADDSLTAGAQRNPYRKFTTPGRRSGHQKTGNIHADNQEYKANGSQKYQQKWPHIADHLLFQGKEACADTMVGVGKGGRQVSRDLGHIRPSLRNRNPRLESSDSVDPQTCAALHEQRVRPLADRSINVLLMEAWRE